MNIDRTVLAMAGAFVLISLALSQLHSPWWLVFTALVGVNLLVAAFTRFCPMVMLLRRFGVPSGAAFN